MTLHSTCSNKNVEIGTHLNRQRNFYKLSQAETIAKRNSRVQKDSALTECQKLSELAYNLHQAQIKNLLFDAQCL